MAVAIRPPVPAFPLRKAHHGLLDSLFASSWQPEVGNTGVYVPHYWSEAGLLSI